jgi:hypothetical protein
MVNEMFISLGVIMRVEKILFLIIGIEYFILLVTKEIKEKL